MNTTRIVISRIVGGGICVSTTDGQKVHNAIYRELEQGNRVELSFREITRLTTAFLNAAIGQLYGEFDENAMRALMAPPVDTEGWQRSRIKMVTDRAKRYFQDAESEEDSVSQVTGLQ